MKIRGIVIAAALVSGCGDSNTALQKGEHNPSICSPIEERELIIPSDFASQANVLHQCVENWAARLSRSNDSADVVVDATMAACSDAISALAPFAAGEGKVQEFQTIVDIAKETALFRVVQWRAGNCRLNDED